MQSNIWHRGFIVSESTFNTNNANLSIDVNKHKYTSIFTKCCTNDFFCSKNVSPNSIEILLNLILILPLDFEINNYGITWLTMVRWILLNNNNKFGNLFKTIAMATIQRSKNRSTQRDERREGGEVNTFRYDGNQKFDFSPWLLILLLFYLWFALCVCVCVFGCSIPFRPSP